MVSLILSNVLDYQSFLDTIFEAFLIKNRVSGITRKNYRSDLKNFFGWVVQTGLSINSTATNSSDIMKAFLQAVTSEVLEDYKRQQSLSGIPISTINRRLSSVRMLFRYAETSGWINENPMFNIKNIIAQPKPESPENLVSGFEKFLTDEGASKVTIKSYVNDVNEFFNWLSTNQ